jgi:cyclophilin family peptidyl-prolyl cis-trans isomerase
VHPRGIKVRLESGEVGRVQYIQTSEQVNKCDYRNGSTTCLLVNLFTYSPEKAILSAIINNNMKNYRFLIYAAFFAAFMLLNPGSALAAPVVGAVSAPTNVEAGDPALIKATVSSSVSIQSCQLYVDNDNKGNMVISGGIASLNYTFPYSQVYTVFVFCKDTSGGMGKSDSVAVWVKVGPAPPSGDPFGGDDPEPVVEPLAFPGVLPESQTDTNVRIETAKGNILIELLPSEGPKAASNFVYLIGRDFYDGLTFHRVVPDFVIQGGDPLGNGTGGPGYSFEDDPVNLPYERGIVAMANSGPNTNGSQFFIVLKDTELPPTYSIFGRVLSGLDVVDQIAQEDVMTDVVLVPKIGSFSYEAGSLIKLECPEGAEANDPCKAVYYYGADEKRHAFPNSKVYFTWYENFDSVMTVSSEVMSGIMLGKNVTYRPGVKMVKFTTVNKVYALSKGGVLRWVTTEEVAVGLYGEDWNTKIDDIPDTFFTNYSFGLDIALPEAYGVSAEMDAAPTIDDSL